MATVLVRLVGRFVWAQPVAENGKRAHAIAVDPSVDAALRARAQIAPHRVLMTIPRLGVTSPGAETAAFSSAAGDDLQRAEHRMWDLTGCTVTIGREVRSLARDETRRNNVVVPMLDELQRSGDFDPTCLQPGAKGGLVTARITVTEGRWTPVAIAPTGATFVSFDAGQQSTLQMAGDLADALEVSFDSDLAVPITISGPGEGRSTSLTISPREPATIVSISNLCVQPPEQEDWEFAAFYGVLTSTPPLKDRLIPKTVVAGFFTEDCYTLAGVTYPRK